NWGPSVSVLNVCFSLKSGHFGPESNVRLVPLADMATFDQVATNYPNPQLVDLPVRSRRGSGVRLKDRPWESPQGPLSVLSLPLPICTTGMLRVPQNSETVAKSVGLTAHLSVP